MAKIRVLIVDDHPLFRDGLRALLESVEDIQVSGEAEEGEEAVRQVQALRPDVVLMDIQMPGQNGLDATRRIVQLFPKVRVLVLTMFDEDDSVFAAVRVGARGYLLKGARQEEVLRAIHSVANDEAIFGPQIAERVMRFFAMRPTEPRPPAQETFPSLTPREIEVLELIAQRLTNAEIAARLVLSTKTVRNHVSNIFSKLQAADRIEVIQAARAAGLGRPSHDRK